MGSQRLLGLTYPLFPRSGSYDMQTRMKTEAGATYTYDGDGKRVQKNTGKLYWYTSAAPSAGGAGSDPLAKSDATGNITDDPGSGFSAALPARGL
jgi:hypothetical protein